MSMVGRKNMLRAHTSLAGDFAPEPVEAAYSAPIETPPLAPRTTTPDSWSSAKSGNWSTAANWSAGVPTASSAATISVAGKYTVTISTAAVANSLTVNDATATVADNDSLSLSTSLALTAGTFSLGGGGEVVGGTISVASSGIFSISSGTLVGVTYQGVLNLTPSGSTLYVVGGLTDEGAGGSGAGTINITGTSAVFDVSGGLSLPSGGTINDTGDNSAFLYSGSGTLNNATINIGENTGNGSYLDGDNVGGILTLGASTKIVQTGAYAYLGDYYDTEAFVNQGTITASYSGGYLYLYGLGLTNTGHISVSNGNTFVNQSNGFANTGTISATGAGTVVDLGNWSNTGSIGVSNGAVLNLGGAFTSAALSSITDTGGVIGITGDLLNTGGTLSVGTGSALGNVSVSGTITGGTIADGGGGIIVTNGALLSGVIYEGVLNVTSSGASLYVVGGLTQEGVGGIGAGTINITGTGVVFDVSGGLSLPSGGTINDTGDNSAFLYSGSGTLNNATINIGENTGNGSYLDGDNVGGTLSLGASTKILQTGAYAYLGGYYSTEAFVNQGTITASYSGGNFYVYGPGFSNAAKIVVSSGDVFSIESASFANTGTISVSGGGVFIIGDTITTAALSGITNSGGNIGIAGALVNTGSTLSVGTGSALGIVSLSGTINGGTIADSGGSLIAAGGTLSGVTYQGMLNLNSTNATLYATEGLTLQGVGGSGAGTINDTGAYAALLYSGSGTISNATINIGESTGAGSYLDGDPNVGGTLTLGSTTKLVQAGAFAYLGGDTDTEAFVNQGTITASYSGGNFYVYGPGFTNSGQIIVSNGDILTLNVGLTNLKSSTITGGSYEVEAASTFQLGNNLSIVTDAATIILSGANSVIESENTASGKEITIDQKLVTIASTGTLELLSGRNFSASAAFTDSGLLQLGGTTFTAASGLTIATTGTLTGFGKLSGAVANSGSISATGGTLTLTGAVSGTGGLSIGTGATLEVGAATTATNIVSYAGTLATLKIDSTGSFASPIANLAVSDRIDLANTTVTSVSTSGTVIDAVTAAGTIVLTLTAPLVNEHLVVSSDGNSGSYISAYAYAQPSSATPNPLSFGNVHVNATPSQSLTLTNTAPASSYSEALDASLISLTGNFAASGTGFTGLAAGATNSTGLVFGLSNDGAGGVQSGTAIIGLSSDGTGIDGFGQTPLSNQTISLTGTVYNYAAGTLASSAVTLAISHVGSTDSAALTLTNTAAVNGYSEALDAGFGIAAGSASVGGSVSLLAAGLSSTALSIGVATTASGTFSGSDVVNLTSDGTGIDGLGTTSLAPVNVTVTGIVDNYALATFVDTGPDSITGSGTSYSVNLGGVAVGSAALTLTLGAENAATGLADLLQGSLTTAGAAGFTNTGFGSFSGLGAGQSELSQSVTLSTSNAGVFSETVLLSSAGTNASGYNGALVTETLTISGTIVSAGTNNTYTLLSAPNTILGAAGGDVFIANGAGSLNSRDSLTGGSGGNTLQLSGGGVFDVGAPSVFSNIGVVNASEGQAASGTLAATSQLVFLRNNSTETVNVATGTAAAGNKNSETITIYDGNDTDTYNLGAGADKLYLGTGTDIVNLGGATNSITAGGGTVTITGTAAQAVASIVGNASSTTTLNVSSAGTIKLNAADTYLTVNIAGSSKLTLGALGFITANGGAGKETITAGGANQTLIGGTADVLNGVTTGSDTFYGLSAALNGDTIGNWATGDVIDLTDMNSATLNPLTYTAGKTNGVLTVTDGTHSSAITFSTTSLALHNFTVVGSDGHGGTLIDWHS